MRALKSIGFDIVRQKGSHIVVRRDDPYSEVVIPNHKKLARGTLRAIIRQIGLSVDEFIELL
ncbi:type II toxin-antitoxin system HicA family toxin [Oscillatoria sp. FACHB-1407]|uniref:type II toxin-antitoxin system HicA family toxin n=1 Tax=Oscillatoria sp. FACHB-1407 TaxID=2692847 RepID=UPI0030DA916E